MLYSLKSCPLHMTFYTQPEMCLIGDFTQLLLLDLCCANVFAMANCLGHDLEAHSQPSTNTYFTAAQHRCCIPTVHHDSHCMQPAGFKAHGEHLL